jgi:hypothetical protein
VKCRKCHHVKLTHDLGGCNDCECGGRFHPPTSKLLLKDRRPGTKRRGPKDPFSNVKKGGSSRSRKAGL